jgi:hypothetical protein
MQWIRENRKLVVGIGSALVAILLAGLVWYAYASWANGIRNEGEANQRRVKTYQEQIETSLSTCLDKGRIGAQVAQQEFNSVRDILIGTAQARYVDKDGKSTNASGTLGGGQLISALNEQYPNIDTATWKKLMDVVIGCRTDVQATQDRLITEAGLFDTWRTTGGVFEKKIRKEFPNQNLKVIDREKTALQKRAGIPGDVWLTGEEALAYLTRVISTQAAQDAIRTGTAPDQDLFPTPGQNSTPAPSTSASPR